MPDLRDLWRQLRGIETPTAGSETGPSRAPDYKRQAAAAAYRREHPDAKPYAPRMSLRGKPVRQHPGEDVELPQEQWEEAGMARIEEARFTERMRKAGRGRHAPPAETPAGPPGPLYVSPTERQRGYHPETGRFGTEQVVGLRPAPEYTLGRHPCPGYDLDLGCACRLDRGHAGDCFPRRLTGREWMAWRDSFWGTEEPDPPSVHFDYWSTGQQTSGIDPWPRKVSVAMRKSPLVAT